MIVGIQILGVLFGLLLAYFCFLHYKRQEFSLVQFLFWESLWLGFIFIILFPKITDILLQRLSIDRAMDLFTILGFMFLIFLTFYNYTVINRIKRSLERKIREEALKEIDKI